MRRSATYCHVRGLAQFRFQTIAGCSPRSVHCKDSLGHSRVLEYGGSVGELSRVLRVCRNLNTCMMVDGVTWTISPLLARFLLPNDHLDTEPKGNIIRIMRLDAHGHPAHHLYAHVAGWSEPIRTKVGEYVIRVDQPSKPTLLLTADSVVAYFYAFEESKTLYQLLSAHPDATASELRTAWRLRLLELTASNSESGERARTERAFNILMNPDLRSRYDSMLAEGDGPMPLPYAGAGEILVEGRLSRDEGAFFASRILSYRPEIEKRSLSLLLRNFEFLEDRVVCRDPKHKSEVWLDRGQLPGVHWDLTWNRSKHWLQSRITVEAIFVRTRTRSGQTRLIALPSRTKVVALESITGDVAEAARLQQLIGPNVDVLERIRSEIQTSPVEHTCVQRWLDHLGVGDVGPEFAIWEPDYDAFYFQTLHGRSSTWFLFRNEFLFVLPRAVVAEIPQAGHATYVFAKPPNVSAFLSHYSRVSREDVRRNRHNAANELGFIGRVVRGANKKRWAEHVLRVACGV